MERLIIYGSKYGTTKRYAEKMTEKTGIPCRDIKEVKSLSGIDHVIHFGGLYAGGTKGLSDTIKLLEKSAGTSLTIITVGISDPADEVNIQKIRAEAEKLLLPALREQTDIYHLRGSIDYSRLSFVHRLMMSFLYSQVKKTPLEEQSADARGLIETYGKKADFTDFARLDEIITIIYKR